MLDAIKCSYPDSKNAMHKMLRHWFCNVVLGRPTWEAVVTALRSPVVDMNHLAEQLELKYCKPVQHTMGKFIILKLRSLWDLSPCANAKSFMVYKVA